MDKFVSGFTGTFSAKALGGFAGLFLILVILAVIGWTPERVAAQTRTTFGG